MRTLKYILPVLVLISICGVAQFGMTQQASGENLAADDDAGPRTDRQPPADAAPKSRQAPPVRRVDAFDTLPLPEAEAERLTEAVGPDVSRPAIGVVDGTELNGANLEQFINAARAKGLSVLDPMRARRVKRTITELRFEAIPKEELEACRKLQEAVESLKAAADDESRNAVTDDIRKQLASQFERDLKERERELAEIEERVKSLRDQLDKRKAAQEDIISLQLQTLINDANGLGFPKNPLSPIGTLQSITPGFDSDEVVQ
ncbi:MAG: hypothetical protein R3C19_15295 [Planctomycetaceae bacterium]